jgi:mRNA interferase MazF
MSIPRRGEVWLVDMGYSAKVRPALVLSIGIEGEERVIITVVPHTTSVRGTRFEGAVETRVTRVILAPRVFSQNLIPCS